MNDEARKLGRSVSEKEEIFLDLTISDQGLRRDCLGCDYLYRVGTQVY
jgi:hypothetical protein